MTSTIIMEKGFDIEEASGTVIVDNFPKVPTSSMSSHKFLNVKVGVKFFDLLNTIEPFKTNWKAISGAYYLLQRIKSHNDTNDGQPSEIHHSIIHDAFKGYTREGEYTPYVNALERLELLYVDRHFNPQLKWNNRIIEDGHCMKYLVIEKASELLFDSELEYIKTLHANPRVKRRNQINIAKRKVMHKDYADFVLNYIHDTHKHLSFEFGHLEQLISGSNDNFQREHLTAKALAVMEKKYVPLKYNESDGRVFNDFSAMSSNLRQILKYKSMIYRATLDIRACHPTFWSSYVLSINANNVTEEMKREHNRWVELFTDPESDPREVIMKECGYDSMQQTKDALIKTLNGSKQYKKLLDWWESVFPNLFAVWQSTDTSRTGNNICKLYECKTMLDSSLFKMTDAMNIKLGYEYDGFGIFTDDPSSIDLKLETLVAYLREEALQRWGIPIVLKVKVQH